MDMDQLVALWKLYLSRRKWEQTWADAEARGDTAGVAAAEQALADLPMIGALDALRANADLVNMLSVQRWIAMRDAREHGATLEQIGQVLGVSRQSAWEMFQRKLAQRQQHQGHESTQDGDADRAETDRGGEE